MESVPLALAPFFTVESGVLALVPETALDTTYDMVLYPQFTDQWFQRTLIRLLGHATLATRSILPTLFANPATALPALQHRYSHRPNQILRALYDHIYVIIAHFIRQWWQAHGQHQGTIVSITKTGIYFKLSLVLTHTTVVDLCTALTDHVRQATTGLSSTIFAEPLTTLERDATTPPLTGFNLAWQGHVVALHAARYTHTLDLSQLYAGVEAAQVGFDLVPQFQAKFATVLGLPLPPNAHQAIHKLVDFIGAIYPHCFKAAPDGSTVFAITASRQRSILLFFLRIFNDYGLLSRSAQDVLYKHPTKARLMYPVPVYDAEQTPLYPFIYTEGEHYDRVISLFLALCPFNTVLFPIFKIRSYDPVVDHPTFMEYLKTQNHLPLYPFPAMPDPSVVGFAFLDGFLCLGDKQRKGMEYTAPHLSWVPWAQANSRDHVGLAERTCHAFVGDQIDALLAIPMHTEEPSQYHWLYFFIQQLNGPTDPMFRAIYAIVLIVLKQLRSFTASTAVRVHDINDMQAWQDMTVAEWNCVEYLVMVMGWTLGVHCNFPVILWLQGAPNTGKSTIVSFVESMATTAAKLNPADNSKHLLNILHPTASGAIVADALVVVDDVQRPLPYLAIQQLCSIVDPGPSGSLSCDPKGADPLVLSKTQCRNVCAIGAANIPTSIAFGADEHSSGIYRRASVVSLPVSSTEADTNPSDILAEPAVRAMLVVLATTTGFYHSKRCHSHAPKPPALLQSLNTNYEQHCTDDIGDIVQQFVLFALSPTHPDANKAMPCSDIHLEFNLYYQKKIASTAEKRHITKAKFTDCLKKAVQDVFPDEAIRYYAKLVYCVECYNIYSWEDPTGQNHTHWLTLSEAKTNAQTKGCQCNTPGRDCRLISKNGVFSNLHLRTTE
jgi:hypothetical protein